MEAFTNLTWSLRIWRDSRGQDLIEYALLAGMLAVGAGALLGGVADNLGPLVSQVVSVAAAASGFGSAPPTGNY